MQLNIKSNIKGITKELGKDQKAITKATPQAINRVIQRGARVEADKAIRETYNISKKNLKPYIRVAGKATRAKPTGSLTLITRSVPLQFFGAKTKAVNTVIRGRKRKMLGVTVKIKKTSANKVTGGFVRGKALDTNSRAAQRSAFYVSNIKRMPAGKRVPDSLRLVKRVSKTDPKKLTSMRSLTFPAKFIKQRVAPRVFDRVGNDFPVVFRNAYRKEIGRNRGRLQKPVRVGL